MCFVHGQGQKSEQKHTTKSFDEFHNHSPLLAMVTFKTSLNMKSISALYHNKKILNRSYNCAFTMQLFSQHQSRNTVHIPKQWMISLTTVDTTSLDQHKPYYCTMCEIYDDYDVNQELSLGYVWA